MSIRHPEGGVYQSVVALKPLKAEPLLLAAEAKA